MTLECDDVAVITYFYIDHLIYINKQLYLFSLKYEPNIHQPNNIDVVITMSGALGWWSHNNDK